MVSIIAAALLAAACGGDSLDQLADGGQGRVADASSGEVLRLQDGRSVRLAGVDAPGGGEPLAAEAQAALHRLARGRTIHLLHGGGERADPYGRPLAHVRVSRGRRWVQGALLDAGLARVRTSAGEASLAREMLGREARARARGRGLWGQPAYRVRLPQEVGPGETGFLLVEGRVRRTTRIRDRVFLDFGADRRRDFSVEIPSRARADFEAAGLPLDALHGRLLRVRGAVKPSGYGPVMRVDHPEQVELLEGGARP